MSSTKLITKDDGLYLDFAGKSHKVIRGFESFTGWYHFATEISTVVIQRANGTEDVKECKQGNTKMPELKPGDKVTEVIFFGFVQGFEDEWGSFALSELQEVMKTGKEWEIKARDLPHSGRRN